MRLCQQRHPTDLPTSYIKSTREVKPEAKEQAKERERDRERDVMHRNLHNPTNVLPGKSWLKNPYPYKILTEVRSKLLLRE